MRGRLFGYLVCFFLLTTFAGAAYATEYEHEVDARGIKLFWKIADGNLNIKVSARTTGWIGVGFNPSDQMKDANIIIGYVDDGKVEIRDDFGESERDHNEDEKLGGTSNVTVVGGEEKGGSTTLEFTIPMNSGDKYDSVIDPQGETTVLLAYGGKRDSLRSKHKFRTSLKINLSTGKVAE